VAKIPAQIRKVIDEYVRALENNHIHIRSAVLFGSYAEGRANEWSDIDIYLDVCALSRPFDDQSFMRIRT
jgi:predicted nucleotidyltransferase